MSWYSGIYIYVRDTRKRRPLWGFVLHLLLNVFLVFQVLLAGYVYYVYVFVVCGGFLQSAAQVAIYLFVFFSLMLMMHWSLAKTVLTPVAQVPARFRVDAQTDARLKECTPCKNGRYFPDQSSVEQVERQNDILTAEVEGRGMLFAETDHFGRIRYCYQCAALKPDRSHHCSSCGFCVVRFDHHCPWINKCVSYSNYKFFVLYVLYVCLVAVWCLATSLEAVVRYFVNQRWKEEALAFVSVLTLLIMCAMCCYAIGELLVYHYKLSTENETTCEHAKPPIIRGDPKADYNFGPAFNFRSVFGWGLWLFPVSTSTTDGMHFPIRYSDAANPNDMMCVRPTELRSQDSAQANK